MEEVREVPISEATKILGVSADTIKRRLKRGELKGHKRPTARGEVWHIQIETEGDDDGDEAEEQHAETAALRATLQAKDDVIAAKDQTIALLTGQLDARTRELHQAHVLLQQALGHQSPQIEALPAQAEHPRRPRTWRERIADWLER